MTPRRAIWAAIALVLIGAAGGAGVALVQPRTYTASATVFIADPRAETGVPVTYASEARASYAALATAPIVLEPVIGLLHLRTTREALARAITTSAPNDTVTFDVIVHDPSAVRSATIANAVVTELRSVVTKVTPSGTEPAPHLAVVHDAVAPTTPNDSAIWVDGALGALIGAGLVLLGIIIAVVRRAPAPAGDAAPSMRF